MLHKHARRYLSCAQAHTRSKVLPYCSWSIWNLQSPSAIPQCTCLVINSSVDPVFQMTVVLLWHNNCIHTVLALHSWPARVQHVLIVFIFLPYSSAVDDRTANAWHQHYPKLFWPTFFAMLGHLPNNSSAILSKHGCQYYLLHYQGPYLWMTNIPISPGLLRILSCSSPDRSVQNKILKIWLT